MAALRDLSIATALLVDLDRCLNAAVTGHPGRHLAAGVPLTAPHRPSCRGSQRLIYQHKSFSIMNKPHVYDLMSLF